MDADILRTGNEQLLNNLKEGVIIMDQESGMVMFLNTAAKRFNIRMNKFLSISLVKEEDGSEKFLNIR